MLISTRSTRSTSPWSSATRFAVAASILATVILVPAAAPATARTSHLTAPPPPHAIAVPARPATVSSPARVPDVVPTAAPTRAQMAAARRAARALVQAATLAWIQRSARVLDIAGLEPSAYRGRFYSPAAEAVRRCVFPRESNANYRSTNRANGYFGGYQMSPELAVGATWMMMAEHRSLVGAKQAKKVLSRLRAKLPHRWNRYWQDAAFFTIYSWKHTGSGAKHWAGGRWHC